MDDAESFAVVLVRTMIQIRPIFRLTDIGQCYKKQVFWGCSQFQAHKKQSGDRG